MNRAAPAPLAFRLNGAPVAAEPRAGERLSETLRSRLGALEVKVGCDAGDCGACTVLIDGAPVCACLTPARRAEGRSVETVAALRESAEGRALAAAFEARGAAQCGICTPGMMVSAAALLRVEGPKGEAEIERALAGVLCRCTGYRKIVAAVADAAAGRIAPAPVEGGVGAGVIRRDGAEKVAGLTRFGDDLAPPGALVLRIIRSPHPRAAFAFGDLEAWAAARPWVACVLSAADVPGENRFGVIPAFADQPVFAVSEARFRGEAVAAVAGEAEAMARFDPEDFPVSWAPLPAVESPAAARAPGAAALHEGRPGNQMCRGFVARGDAEAALARAAHVVEGRLETSFVEHAYIEPEAGFAEMKEERLEVSACTQAPGMDREALALILGWPESRIRIRPTAVGGGFGAKLDLSVQPYLALAAIRTGRPVRIVWSRSESMRASTKRHPAAMRVRIGADADGRLCGLAFEGEFDTGAYASWGPTVANRVPVHASGPYLVRDYRAEAQAIHSNNPPSGAFRGFGVPQAAAAAEPLMDELALRLGLDPLEFRLLNALRDGEPTVTGQVFAHGVGIAACLEALRAPWKARRAAAEAFNAEAKGPLRRGVGLAVGWYGCGNTSLPNPSTIRAGVTPEGRIVLHQGAMDIGQGADTVIPQIFAEALGAPLSAIEIVGADTDLTPDAGKTSASRQTFVTGNAARLAGLALRARLLALVNAGEGARIGSGPEGLTVTEAGVKHRPSLSALPPDDLGYAIRVEETYDPPTKPLDASGQGEPYAQFGYAAHIAEVEVDLALGTVRPLGFVAAHDVGRAINPLLIEGQVEGGIAQGLGMALMEEYIPGRTENLHDYLIPTIGDMPPVETVIVEAGDMHGPFGAKGLGEHALIPTAPAILNAIAHATGVRPSKLPATPARLFAALRKDGA
ncbi:MAG: molybdopterin-dependent oxidoreductase [Pikeienuella sp.]|uniref:molybdopterin-dependent oxidoreductase n=1 Tax=Pikeienuella sp. TaxID=2831957 RepID=UPI00391DF52C